MCDTDQADPSNVPTPGPNPAPEESGVGGSGFEILDREPTTLVSRREHLQALLLALVCAVLFLRDGLVPGRALVPHPPELFDVHMAEAKATGSFDAEDTFRGNVGMTDKYLQSLCWDRVMQDRLRQGELPRWTRDIGGGAPFVPQMAQPYQPINLLLLCMPSVEWYGLWYLVHLVLFGWFAYQFCRRIGCLHAAALLGLVAATLGMWTQCKLHHNVVLTAALSLWPMLSATHQLVAERVQAFARRRAIGWLAMWAGLSWSTGFVVVALQATYLTAAFAVFCALRANGPGRWRRLLPVGLGFAIGGVLSFANMLPILLAAAESARSGQFDAARLQSLGLEWDHLLSLPWPNLFSWPADVFYPAGGESLAYETRMPWSQLVLLHPLRPEDQSAFQNWVETSFAIGVIPLAAAVTALFRKRHRLLAWFFAGIALLAFGIATGNQPFFSIARLLPGMTAGDLRRLLFCVAMPLVVLSALGCDAWLRDGVRWPARVALGLVIVVSATVIAWAVMHSSKNDFVQAYANLYVLDGEDQTVRLAGGDPAVLAQGVQQLAKPGEPEANRQHLLSSAIWALLVALAGVVALFRGWWRDAKQLRTTRLPLPMLALLAITITELIVMGLGPVQTVPADRVTRIPKVLAPVLAQHLDEQPRPRLQRLVIDGKASNGLPGNMPGFLGFADANAYNPLPPARFEQFFETIEKGIGYGGAGVGSFHNQDSLSHPLCDLYSIRYVVTKESIPTSATLVDRTPAGTGSFRLLERTTALPRATFVRQVDVIADDPRAELPAQARLQALAKRDRDVRQRMVLERADAVIPKPADDAQHQVQITSHRDERVAVQVRCSHDGYLRLADPYDQGWRATIDGNATDILIADHYLRAVYVPAGEHEILFSYDGARVVWPQRLTLLAWFVVAFLLFAVRSNPRNRQ